MSDVEALKRLLREVLVFNRDHVILDDEPYKDTAEWNRLGQRIAEVLKEHADEPGQCRLCGGPTDAGRTCVGCSVQWGI